MFEKNIFIENIKKSWLIILILTILIFILVPANIAISKNSILEKQQYMEQLGTKLSDDYILKLSNSYTTNAIESKLFTNLNYAIILIIPVFISMQLFTFVRNKEQNTDKKIYITNLGKCTQIDARPLSDKVLRKYLELLYKEIQIVKPKKIIVFGNQVSSIFLNKKICVKSVRKEEFEIEIDKNVYPVYSVFYPIGNGMRNIDLAVEDIKYIIEKEQSK